MLIILFILINLNQSFDLRFLFQNDPFVILFFREDLQVIWFNHRGLFAKIR